MQKVQNIIVEDKVEGQVSGIEGDKELRVLNIGKMVYVDGVIIKNSNDERNIKLKVKIICDEEDGKWLRNVIGGLVSCYEF